MVVTGSVTGVTAARFYSVTDVRSYNVRRQQQGATGVTGVTAARCDLCDRCGALLHHAAFADGSMV